jgi:hypothetical protein
MICDICQCRIYPEDEQYNIVLLDYHVCALCGAASEKLGYKLSIIR